MSKTILITGTTSGIGLEAARELAAAGHRLLLHGRDPMRLAALAGELAAAGAAERVETFAADLSRPAGAAALADAVAQAHPQLDVLIDNAGVFRTQATRTPEGLDVRFAVDTIAPFILTKRLLPRMDATARVINVASAAQAPVDPEAPLGRRRLADMEAYAQSKLALVMWTRHLAGELGDAGPVLVAVNPGSLLATRMVREALGVTGRDVRIGAGILVRAALSPEFANASGRCFDNDSGRFADPHPDALDPRKNAAIVRVIEEIPARLGL
jgi:NAD(P)-dependent dehydrogenase (short-subunit alcohol dehydrogenase family)